MSNYSRRIRGKIDPKDVRHCRLNGSLRYASIQPRHFPNDTNRAAEYARPAVRAYPDPYFARFAILAEGVSERVVVPRLAEAMGVPLDPSLAPVVPLGGRHVEHLWRLLEDLRIPHATSRDLDYGRKHDGARVVRRILGKLRDVRKTGVGALTNFGNKNDNTIVETLSKERLRVQLENDGISVSARLALDFAMLRAFPGVYEPAADGQGPRPREADGEEAKRVVLGKDGVSNVHGPEFKELSRSYRYLFLQRSSAGRSRGRPVAFGFGLGGCGRNGAPRSEGAVLLADGTMCGAAADSRHRLQARHGAESGCTRRAPGWHRTRSQARPGRFRRIHQGHARPVPSRSTGRVAAGCSVPYRLPEARRLRGLLTTKRFLQIRYCIHRSVYREITTCHRFTR